MAVLASGLFGHNAQSFVAAVSKLEKGECDNPVQRCGGSPMWC